jgi:NitT/TauT family transport system substrate-binding protein
MFDRSKGTDGILVSRKVKTVQDLKKVRIAVEEGFVGHFFLLYFLDKNGISTDGLSLVPMTTDAAGAAFAAGKVDAAVTWEPYLSTAMKRPDARILVSSADLEPILADTLFVSDSFLKQRRDDIKKLVQALQEANDYWLAHPADVTPLVARHWKMKEDEVTGIMKTDQLYSVSDQRAQFGLKDTDGDLYRYLSKASELWLKAGVVKQKIDSAQLMDGYAVRTLKGYDAK